MKETPQRLRKIVIVLIAVLAGLLIAMLLNQRNAALYRIFQEERGLMPRKIETNQQQGRDGK